MTRLRTKLLVVTGLVAGLVLGGLPAHGDAKFFVLTVTGGTFTVGDAWSNPGDCTSYQPGEPTGKRLFHSSRTAGKPDHTRNGRLAGKEYFWNLELDVLGKGTGKFIVCGKLLPGVLGWGAACDTHSTKNGRGKLDTTEKTDGRYLIEDLKWPSTTAAQILQLSGKWRQETTVGSKIPSRQAGSLSGHVTLAQNLACMQSKSDVLGGARSFDVIGGEIKFKGA